VLKVARHGHEFELHKEVKLLHNLPKHANIIQMSECQQHMKPSTDNIFLFVQMSKFDIHQNIVMECVWFNGDTAMP